MSNVGKPIEQGYNVNPWWGVNGFENFYPDGVHFVTKPDGTEGIVIVTCEGNGIEWFETPRGADVAQAIQAANDYHRTFESMPIEFSPEGNEMDYLMSQKQALLDELKNLSDV